LKDGVGRSVDYYGCKVIKLMVDRITGRLIGKGLRIDWIRDV
jgi:hypothetical protein